MSSQAGLRRLMFITPLVGNDAFHAMHRFLTSDALRKAFRGYLDELNRITQPVPLGAHNEYRWLATSKAPSSTVLLVERADGNPMGVKEGLQVEAATLARASGLTTAITLVRPQTMVPESAMVQLRENIQNGRRWSAGMPR